MHDVLGWLADADEAILLAVNGYHTPFLDSVMWTLSGRLVWIPLYLFLMWLVFRRMGWKLLRERLNLNRINNRR